MEPNFVSGELGCKHPEDIKESKSMNTHTKNVVGEDLDLDRKVIRKLGVTMICSDVLNGEHSIDKKVSSDIKQKSIVWEKPKMSKLRRQATTEDELKKDIMKLNKTMRGEAFNLPT